MLNADRFNTRYKEVIRKEKLDRDNELSRKKYMETAASEILDLLTAWYNEVLSTIGVFRYLLIAQHAKNCACKECEGYTETIIKKVSRSSMEYLTWATREDDKHKDVKEEITHKPNPPLFTIEFAQNIYRSPSEQLQHGAIAFRGSIDGRTVNYRQERGYFPQIHMLTEEYLGRSYEDNSRLHAKSVEDILQLRMEIIAILNGEIDIVHGDNIPHFIRGDKIGRMIVVYKK